MTSDLARISVTAKVSAYYRKFSDIAFAAEVAALIGADEAFAEIVREHALEPDKLAFYAPMFEARYKSVTQLIGECGATQVLELASGYSLRGLDLTQAGSLHYVETDLPDVVAAKLALLEDVRRRHHIAPRPLHVVTAADVLDPGQLHVAAAGFDRGRPLVVLCEGLVGYLTREETGRLTRNVHGLLGEFTDGWWIVPDFAFKTELRNLPPERIRQVCSQVAKTPSFSTIPALGLSPAVIERMRPLLRVWLLRLVPRVRLFPVLAVGPDVR